MLKPDKLQLVSIVLKTDTTYNADQLFEPIYLAHGTPTLTS